MSLELEFEFQDTVGSKIDCIPEMDTANFTTGCFLRNQCSLILVCWEHVCFWSVSVSSLIQWSPRSIEETYKDFLVHNQKMIVYEEVLLMNYFLLHKIISFQGWLRKRGNRNRSEIASETDRFQSHWSSKSSWKLVLERCHISLWCSIANKNWYIL